jgi:glycosyltransferase involved in cell wall biosynthesis
MDWSARCALIIPCLNEAQTIARLVTAARLHLPTVFVIDDGSTDGTADEARSAGAKVIAHSTPQGKGASLKEAFDVASRHGFSWALCMDGDGQHAPDDIPPFFKLAENSGADLVIGNRMHQAERMPWLRRRVNQWMSARIASLAGTATPDSQCGFRLINLQRLPHLDLRSRHYEFESDMVVQFGRARFRIEFVPVQVIYRQEQSKIRPLTDTLRWLRWWWNTSVAQKNASATARASQPTDDSFRGGNAPTSCATPPAPSSSVAPGKAL